MSLEQERAWYKTHKAKLLEAHLGKWIVVFEDALVGVYDSFGTAYSKGVKVTKNEHIFVHQVLDVDTPTNLPPALAIGILHAPIYK